MKIYIVVVVTDDLEDSETIEYVFATKELAEEYINKCTNLCESEKYRFRIIKEDLITNFNQILWAAFSATRHT